MRNFIIWLIVFLNFVCFVSATGLEIGTDENNLSTFTFNSLTEKIEIENNGAWVTDLFTFSIDREQMHQNVSFWLAIPDMDGRNLSVPSFEYLACGSQLARGNSKELYSPESSQWGLDCGKVDIERINWGSPFISRSMNLSTTPLGDIEKNTSRIEIYVQVRYFLQGYVIENGGEYEYIPIDKFSTSKTYIIFDGGQNRIIVVMPQGTVFEEISNFKLKNIEEGGRLVLEYRSPKDDSLITFRDGTKEESMRFVRDTAIIGISFGLSILILFLEYHMRRPLKGFPQVLQLLGFAAFIFGFSFLVHIYEFTLWSLLAVIILGLIVIVYMVLAKSHLFNNHIRPEYSV